MTETDWSRCTEIYSCDVGEFQCLKPYMHKGPHLFDIRKLANPESENGEKE